MGGEKRLLFTLWLVLELDGSYQGHHIHSLPWTGGYHQGGIRIRGDLPFTQKPLPALCDGTGAPKLKTRLDYILRAYFQKQKTTETLLELFLGPGPDWSHNQISLCWESLTFSAYARSAGQDGIPRKQKSYQRVPWEDMSHDSGSLAPALVISSSSPNLYSWKGTSRPYLRENGKTKVLYLQGH